jgi:hypothetical protein
VKDLAFPDDVSVDSFEQFLEVCQGRAAFPTPQTAYALFKLAKIDEVSRLQEVIDKSVVQSRPWSKTSRPSA